LTLLLNAKVSDRDIVLNDPVNMIDPLGLSTIIFDRSDNKIYVTHDTSPLTINQTILHYV